MQSTYILMDRFSAEESDALLAQFVEALLEVESETPDADENEWDARLKDACQRQKSNSLATA